MTSSQRHTHNSGSGPHQISEHVEIRNNKINYQIERPESYFLFWQIAARNAKVLVGSFHFEAIQVNSKEDEAAVDGLLIKVKSIYDRCFDFITARSCAALCCAALCCAVLHCAVPGRALLCCAGPGYARLYYAALSLWCSTDPIDATNAIHSKPISQAKID